MGKEIEHKYLVTENWKEHVSAGTFYAQSYLADGVPTVRVRIAGDKAYLTLKGRAEGIARTEFEFEIPKEDASEIMKELSVTAVVEKTRYLVEFAGKTWEIDEFHGLNAGLVVAEVELNSEGEEFELPEWAGECVSSDFRYANSNLAREPYSKW